MILLDTCVLLWLAVDQKKNSEKAKNTILDNAGSLFVSSITAFEIAIKNRKGKIELPMALDTWFKKIIDFHGIQEIGISSAIAIKSVQLPLLHNDPCDRFIIATAIQNSMSIVTCDSLIEQYKEVKVIW